MKLSKEQRIREQEIPKKQCFLDTLSQQTRLQDFRRSREVLCSLRRC